MSAWRRFLHSNFMIKFRSWEYWPFGIVQFPLFIYFGWLALRARSFLFFSASNPGITMGGMFGESKFEILEKIPSSYKPISILLQPTLSVDQVMAMLVDNHFKLPVIFKPDLGERGFMVRKINSLAEIEQYLKEIRIEFIAQELVDLPMEFGVFYTRLPSQAAGCVTSVVMKEMLTVTGDGATTLGELILRKDRAKLQWEKLKIVFQDRLNETIAQHEVVQLVGIGNHCLGTKFLDGGYLINQKLSESFDSISKQIDGFYFGRFDLRCASIDALYNGEIKIMELNGCGAEPAHIYQPGYSLLKAIGVLFQHWRNIFLIARENNKRGIAYISLKEARAFYKSFKSATN